MKPRKQAIVLNDGPKYCYRIVSFSKSITVTVLINVKTDLNIKDAAIQKGGSINIMFKARKQD